MGYGPILLVLLLSLRRGKSIDGGGARLTAIGRREATASKLDDGSPSSRSQSSSFFLGTPPSLSTCPTCTLRLASPRRKRSASALEAEAVALLLRGGSDATNAEPMLDQEVVGKAEHEGDTAPDGRQHDGDTHGERAVGSNLLDGKPQIETLYMQSGVEERESAASRINQDSIPTHHESSGTTRLPQRQQLNQDRQTHISPHRLDKVMLPSDSSFVQSPAQLRAFVKRRGGPQPGSGTAGALPQQQPKSQSQAPADENTSSVTAPVPDKGIDKASVSSKATKPAHSLVAPIVQLFVGIVRTLSHPALVYYYAALLGTSVGFTQFLYFSTVGYASGIALPVGIQMLTNPSKVPFLSSTNLSSVLVLLWGIRLAAFLLWREYLNWPALHAHMQHVQPPPLVPTQLLGWVVYSGLYLCVASPVLFRHPPVRNATASTASLSQRNGKGSVSSLLRPSRVALLLQIVGLLLEATADVQKSLFKAQYRHDWCNVGLWKYCTHPNYVGEAMFWVGTHLGGLSNLIQSRHHRSILGMLAQLVTSSAGLSFVLLVLRGAITHSHDTQLRKYGTDPAFVSFQDTYGLFGYRLWKHSIRPALRRAMPGPMIEALEEAA